MSKYSELEIKKYPYLGDSPNFMEFFLIVGYESSYIKSNFIEPIEKKYEEDIEHKSVQTNDSSSEQKLFSELISKDPPSILNSISSNFDRQMLPEDKIISFIFPNNPIIYYNPDVNNPNLELNPINVIFFINADDFNRASKNPFHGYAFIFFDIKQTKFQQQVFIPKAFCFISQYPFFMQFNSLAKDILKLYNIDNLEIPIEILVYNIVNFTPSPIYHSLFLNLLPSIDLSMYSKTVTNMKSKMKAEREKNPNSENIFLVLPNTNNIDNKRVLTHLSGYPFFDFNLSEIFSILPTSSLIEIIIFNFLEEDMIFFSKNLEILNLVMYIIASLSYPCNDSIYLWHILSVKKESIKDQGDSEFVGKPCASMIGVNCSYDDTINTCEIYRTHFIIDLDEKKISLKYKEEDLDDEDSDSPNSITRLKNLQSYIRKILDGKKVTSIFLEKTIKQLLADLKEPIEKIIHAYYGHSNQILTKFFITENNSISLNKKIQEAFYNFILNILKVYVNLYEFKPEKNKTNFSVENPHVNSLNNSSVCINNQLNLSGWQNIHINLSETSIDSDRDKSYVLTYKEDFSKFSPEEITFCFIFKESCKYSNYLFEFFKEYKGMDLYKIPLIYSEEFINIKNNENDKFNSHFFEMMDKLFYSPNEDSKQKKSIINNKNALTPTTPEIKYINFLPFYSFYEEHWKNFFFEELRRNSLIRVSFSKSFNKTKVSYKYTEKEFDNNILIKYIYLLSKLEDKQIEELFPSIAIQKENLIHSTKIKEIENSIEKSLIQYKLVTYKEIITFSFYLLIGILSEEIKSNKEIIQLLKLVSHTSFCLRKYIIIYLSIAYRIAERKIKKKDYAKKEFDLYYKLLMLMRIRKILPNEQTMKIVNLFKELEEERSLLILTNTPNEENSNEERDELELIQEDYNINNFAKKSLTEDEIRKILGNKRSTISEVKGELKKSTMYKLFLKRNFCHEGIKNNEFFLKFAENIGFDGDIKAECPQCHITVTPQLYLKDNETKVSYTSALFSPLKIYNECSKLMEQYYSTIDYSKVDWKLIKDIIQNIIFLTENIAEWTPTLQEFLLRLLRTIK